MCSRRRTVLLLFTSLVAASPVLAQRLPFETGSDTATPGTPLPALPLPAVPEPPRLPVPGEDLPPPPITSAPQPPGTLPPSAAPAPATSAASAPASAKAAAPPAVVPPPKLPSQPIASQAPPPPVPATPAASVPPAVLQPAPANTQAAGAASDPGGPSTLGLIPSSDMNPATYNWTKQATQDAFAFEAAAARDRKLAEWCDTGFAPAHLCARRRPKEDQAPQQPAQIQVQPQPQRPPTDLPVGDPYSKEITIWGDSANAVLVYPDGSTQTVKQHDTLADGSTIVSMSVRDGVKVRRPDGKLITLRRKQNAAPPTYQTGNPGQSGMPTPMPVPPPTASLLNQPFQR